MECESGSGSDSDEMEVSEPEYTEDTIPEEDEDAVEDGEPGSSGPPERKVYLPGQTLKRDQILEPDHSAYVMLHEANAGTPCLSFDIIPDNLGKSRETFPHTCYIVTGTQARKRNENNIIVMKLSNLQKTLKEKENEDDSTDDSSSSDEEVDADGLGPKAARMNSSTIQHYGCINRIRTCQYNNTVLAAAWSEMGQVNIYDLKSHLSAVENRSTIQVRSSKKKGRRPVKAGASDKPLHSFSGHMQEGYAMDWSPTAAGVLATGDCSGNIHVWSPRETDWHVDLRPLKSHTKSVEDLQWSPSESNVLASCSVDKSLKIWDIRATPNKACMLTLDDAHTSDVNVISWNRMEPLIVSGGDDGYLKVWDLRQFKNESAVATFKHHTEPVTTVEWHPSDNSVFASGGEDNQVSLWDLSVERDDELNAEEVKEIPPQLLFIHLGQTCVKEVHWHPQIPGALISTAETGFNVFKTISV